MGVIAGGIIGLGQSIGGWISGKDKEKKQREHEKEMMGLQYQYNEAAAKSLRSKNKPDNDLFSVIKNDSSLSADMETALLGFAAMRKEIKKPLTQRGCDLLFNCG